MKRRSASGRPRRSIGRSSGRRRGRSPSLPTRTAATTFRTPNSRWTRMERSSRCGSIPSPISAPILRPSGPRFRPISMGFCCRDSTTSPRSTVRSMESTPIRFPSTPSAEPAGLRRPIWLSASWRRPRVRRDAIRPISAAKTSSSHSRIRRRSSSPMTWATIPRRSTRRLSSPTTRAWGPARRRPPRKASCAASASRPISRRAASRPRKPRARSARGLACGNRPKCASIWSARSRS